MGYPREQYARNNAYKLSYKHLTWCRRASLNPPLHTPGNQSEPKIYKWKRRAGSQAARDTAALKPWNLIAGHVEEGVGVALFVEWGAAIDAKTHVFVEGSGGGVLFVYFEMSYVQLVDTFGKELSSVSLTTC